MDDLYRLSDTPRLTDLMRLGFGPEEKPWMNPRMVGRQGLMAIKTGEERPPKSGEWFLSGAIPEAYRARKNMKSTYPIVRLVRTETKLSTCVIINTPYGNGIQ